MPGDSTLPGCFTLKRPMPPNKCENCKYREDCGKFVRKDKLKPILVMLENLEQKMRV